VTATFKYRAFLSYSHVDSDMAKRVHSRLEGFHIDKELVGRVTSIGPIPQTLRPIFRDRHEFQAGGGLADQTTSSLDESATLIFLASPRAAASRYANEEVRLFKSRHPDRLVIPLIVDGEPGNPERECFPSALRFSVAPDGTITDTPIDILAADLREKADGFELALAKVVARLTGLAPDDVYRRAERERRRQWRLRAVVAAMIGVLAIGGGGFYWQSRQQAQTLAEISALVDKYSLTTEATAPDAKASLTEAITAIANGASADPRYAKALELLKAGKAAEAEPLLKEVAEDKANRAEKDAKDAAAAYRTLASIAVVSDPGRAREYLSQAARLDPSNVRGMLANGWYLMMAGQLDAAQAAYDSALAGANAASDNESLIWAEFGIGEIQKRRGKLSDAMTTFRTVLAMAERLAKSDPGNADWQRDLEVSDTNIGFALTAQGNLPEALKSYRDAQAIAARLAKSDPGNAQWQDDLLQSDDEIGDMLLAQGNSPEALTSYRAARAVADRLAKSDPGNVGWQRDLAVSDRKIGNVLLAQGNLPEALRSYRDALAIDDRLAKSNPDDASWQQGLAISDVKVGDVLLAQGNLPEALTSYRAARAVADRLVRSDPSDADWQRGLAVSGEKVGDVLLAQGNPSEALTSYRAAHDAFDELAKSDPSDADWQRDLSVSDRKIGNVLLAQSDLPEALTSYRAALAIADRLVKSDPSNADWQDDIAAVYARISDVLERQGNLPKALTSYRAARAVADRLAKSDPGNVGWQRDLAFSYLKIGDMLVAQSDLPEALTSYRAGHDIFDRLTKSDPGNADWQSDLRYSVEAIGGIAYRFLLAREFTKALETADLSISYAPALTWLYTNRAHALMLLGNTDEARTIYLKHRGEKTLDLNTWETSVRDDFVEMRKAGLSNPLMDEIEALFATQ
jgi:tetratricopeptide (TPR) repeat protein